MTSQGPWPRAGGEDLAPSTRALLDAILAISGDLDFDAVLQRLVRAAVDLTGAQHGALGLLGPGGELTGFITADADSTAVRASGTPAELSVEIRIRGTAFGDLRLTGRSAGGSFTARDSTLVEAFASAAALVIENARAYGLSERRRHWLEASAELADALQPPIRAEAALTEFASRARAAAAAIAAVVVQFPPDGHPVIAASAGAKRVDVTPIVRRVVDAARAADAAAMAVDVDLGGTCARVVPMRAHLADPSVLVVVLRRPGSDDEREFLAGFTEQAGLALDRAQAFADRQDLALITERDRIGRDLHDVVIQRLFAAGLKLESLRAEIAAARSERAEALVDDLVGDLNLTITDIRSTVFGLQVAEAGSTRERIHTVLRETGQRLGSTPQLRTHGPLDDLDDSAADQLTATIDAAIGSAARAHADVPAVEIWVGAESVTAQVQLEGAVDSDELRRALRESAATPEGGLPRFEVAQGAEGAAIRWVAALRHAA